MALALRNINPPLPVSNAVHALPRFGSQQQLSLHLVAQEPRDKAQLSGPPSLHRAVLAMGINDVQPGAAWHGAQG